MNKLRTLSLGSALLLAGLWPAAPLLAQTPVPGLCGFNRLTLAGDSDTIVSTPFARQEAAIGLVLGATGNQVTFKNSPDWTPGLFVYSADVQSNTYYLQVRSGSREGAAFLVIGSDAAAVSVHLNGGTLSGLAAGDRVAIVPFWTLGTLFPGGSGVHVSPTANERRTEVLFPNLSATGINAPPERIFYCLNGSWRQTGQGDVSQDDVILLPDSYVVVRHNVGASTRLMCSGTVLPSKLVSGLATSSSTKRDNYLALQRPGAVSLADSGLISSGAFSASPTAGNRSDELHVFDNAAIQKNKAASAVYYYWNSAWRKVGAGASIFNTAQVFTPGAGFMIRKNAAATSSVWLNAPGY